MSITGDSSAIAMVVIEGAGLARQYSQLAARMDLYGGIWSWLVKKD